MASLALVDSATRRDGTPPPLDEETAGIICRDLSFTTGGRQLLDVPALRLDAAVPTLIMGPNGAGKSLLLRILHGLLVPDRGDVRFHGGLGERQAMVFQKPVILRRSVSANVDYALKVSGVARPDRRGRIDALLERGKLKEKADQPARTLSGGEQQRLAMLRALATRPTLIFLDEPCAGLDPQSTGAIEAMMKEAEAEKVKVVLVTHDIGQARRIGGEVIFMNKGRVVEQAWAEPFLNHPATREAGAFLDGALLT